MIWGYNIRILKPLKFLPKYRGKITTNHYVRNVPKPVYGTIYYYAEHKKNARKSTWNKHTKHRAGRASEKKKVGEGEAYHV